MMEPLIFYTFKVSLCLGAGFLLYYILVRRETFHKVKRFILLGILTASLAIPLVRLPAATTGMAVPLQKLESSFSEEIPVVQQEQPAERSTPASEIKPGISPSAVIYLAGAAIQGILFLLALSRIILLLARLEKTDYGRFRLVLVQQGIVPFCFGRYIVLSAQDFTEHGREVLMHEQAHLASRHNLDLLFAELLIIMTWYNPFSWLLRREMKLNHEFEADRLVLKQGADAAAYQLLLVRRAAGDSRYRLASMFNQSNIKTRIAMMTKENSRPLRIFRILLFIPLAFLAVLVFARHEPASSVPDTASHPAGSYLVLNPGQMTLLGFEVKSTGLYYENTPSAARDKDLLCLYFTDKIYSASLIVHPGEKIDRQSQAKKILKQKVITTNDFYPVAVTSYAGARTLDMTAGEVNPGMKLLPVQIDMAGVLPGKRSDTLVFWFKPTESLKKVLSSVGDISRYLQPCPADSR